MDSEKRPVGRPSIYTEDMAEEICKRLAGGESLRAICRDEHMPHISSVLLWVVDGKHKSFSEQYMRAREAQGFCYADNILEVTNLIGRGEMDPTSAKVIIDAYKWTAERNAPKSYGVKQQVDHVSSDSSMTPKPAIDATKLSDAALAEIMAAKGDA